MLTFRGEAKDIEKIRKLVRYTLSLRPEAATADEPPNKKIKFDTQDGSVCETEGILSSDKLSYLHINFAQKLLKQQFPWVNGTPVHSFAVKEQSRQASPGPTSSDPLLYPGPLDCRINQRGWSSPYLRLGVLHC